MDLRELLFADQALDALLAGLPRADRGRSRRSAENPWPLLFRARELAAQGRFDAAAEALHAVAELGTAETRVRLWAWRALRGLGVEPEGPRAREVLGVVLELPLALGVDTLAGYRDGSARYVNQGGTAVAFDGGDAAVSHRLRSLLDAAGKLAGAMPLAGRRPPPKSRVRFSLLTREGIRCGEEDLARSGKPESFLSPVFRAATGLMEALLRRE